jgi:glycerophosphoryl diester phosphodiesterase
MQQMNLFSGLKAAGVMEVDLRLTWDRRFVCLHDERVDGETTGVNPISEQPSRSEDTQSSRAGDG